MTDEAGAWNPGLQSDIPQPLWPLVTLFRAEHAFVNYRDACELADFTGLQVLDLIALKPQRLVLHTLLVRVTADLSVTDDPLYQVLGINLRGMVERINSAYMLPEMPRISAAWQAQMTQAQIFVKQQLERMLEHDAESAPEPIEKPSLLKRLFGHSASVQKKPSSDTPELVALRYWKEQAQACDDDLQLACFKALVKTVDAIVAHRGRMLPDHDLVARIVVNQVGNTYGAEVIDKTIDDIWHKAVTAEGYRVLPAQEKPVVMNVKGASASGKSTIRPQQRQLAGKLGIPWEDFALISPDYWRKSLLDYDSLGDDYKYAAMLTGRELAMVDQKLDRYMACKASRGSTSHLLIDRFRFDSFTVNIDSTVDSRLLSRFGDRVYLFFMVTHPVETVERAWVRGQKTGRYKAVDDLLFHNVEAFTGMPSLFLSWVRSQDKQIHFEFLDNDVPEGELPRTAAFGWNNTLTVLDVNLLLNIDRYKKVDIAATEPDRIFSDDDLAADVNTGFITQCMQRVKDIVFADQLTAKVYARVLDGKLVWWDHDYIDSRATEQSGLLETMKVLGYRQQPCAASASDLAVQIDVHAEKRVTVGRWH